MNYLSHWYAKQRAQWAQYEVENRANPMLRVVREMGASVAIILWGTIGLLVLLIMLAMGIVAGLQTPRATPPAPTPMVVYVDRPVLMPYPVPGEGK